MTGTDPEELRRTVALAVLPLLSEYPTLTTARIARAAGIEEAELLAVFDDKEAVMQACGAMIAAQLSAITEPADEVRKVAAIRVDQPLAARLTEVLGIIDAYHRRVRAELGAFEQAVLAGTAGASGAPAPSGRTDLRFINTLPEVRQAVAGLLEPDEQRLRLPAEALAEAFLTMASVGARTENEHRAPLPAEQIVDLFLHGAVITG